VGIGLAYVPAGRADPETPIEIDIRGKHRAGVVARKPLYSSRTA
jgi:glycine cleavage system aminomethyltransferase T